MDARRPASHAAAVEAPKQGTQMVPLSYLKWIHEHRREPSFPDAGVLAALSAAVHAAVPRYTLASSCGLACLHRRVQGLVSVLAVTRYRIWYVLVAE